MIRVWFTSATEQAFSPLFYHFQSYCTVLRSPKLRGRLKQTVK